MKKSIVMTSINPPTDAIKRFEKYNNFDIFIAGDVKSPLEWKYENIKFLSINYQEQKYKILSDLVFKKHYARKNFAYLEAIKNGSMLIFETDDDNFPNNYFPNNITKNITEINEVGGNKFINIYQFFTKENVWPRGLPLNWIDDRGGEIENIKIEPLIQQTLADGDTDVDAIYRLVISKNISFEKKKRVCVARNTFCPFNSQGTFWNYKVFPLMYIPSTVNSRVSDIWRGYIAQRIIWELNSRLIFLSPSIFQKRNIHDFMKDFNDELDLYTKSEILVNQLCTIKLDGGLNSMLYKVYESLVDINIFRKEELDILREWLKYFN